MKSINAANIRELQSTIAAIQLRILKIERILIASFPEKFHNSADGIQKRDMTEGLLPGEKGIQELRNSFEEYLNEKFPNLNIKLIAYQDPLEKVKESMNSKGIFSDEAKEFEACDNCGSVHIKRTLKPKVDISNVVFRLCPSCHEIWGK